MSKFHVKKGDEVVVLAGAEKGKRGKVIAVSPKKNRAIVEGLK
jgi:large subunit ribosomal protein L24